MSEIRRCGGNARPEKGLVARDTAILIQRAFPTHNFWGLVGFMPISCSASCLRFLLLPDMSLKYYDILSFTCLTVLSAFLPNGRMSPF